MMMQKAPTLENTQLIAKLAGMVTEVDVERQCARIVSWLKEHFPGPGIVLSLHGTNTRKPSLHTENVPKDLFKQIQKSFLKQSQPTEPRDEIRALSLREGEMLPVDLQRVPESEETILVAVPLRAENSGLGTLALVSDSATIQSLTGGESPLFSFVPIISSILHNTICHQQDAERIRFLRLYQTVSSALGYVGDLQELLTTIVSIVTAELPSEEGSILLYDEEANEFEFYTAVGETGAELQTERFPADKGIAGRALREGKALIVNDPQNSPDFYGNIDEEHGFKTESILAAPLISGDETVGVVEAINKIGDGGFSEEDKQLLSAIADEVALAIKNARLFDYVVDSYCKIRQGQPSCKGCKRPLKSWTPCVRQLEGKS
ncbi:MAG: GAF domain-containing protein [Deltaproteobacteria bacterium]|nr:GAF domain-containing protein [Deltaproteobacteria bacterium]